MESIRVKRLIEALNNEPEDEFVFIQSGCYIYQIVGIELYNPHGGILIIPGKLSGVYELAQANPNQHNRKPDNKNGPNQMTSK